MTEEPFDFSQVTGFDWDEGNRDKNWIRHRVSARECEEVFFNQPLLALPDVRHSHREARWYALGQTNRGRRLFVAFTVRGSLLRIISARDMSRKERLVYEQESNS